MARAKTAVDRGDVGEKFVTLLATRDPALRQELIEAHLDLAVHLARRFTNRGEPVEDLVQVASVGLVKAVDRFDPSHGAGFSTYATHTIVGELKRHFRDRAWALRPPRQVQEASLKVNRAIATLSQRQGRHPTTSEVAQEIEGNEKHVMAALEATAVYRHVSLNAPISNDGDEFGARLGDEDRGFQMTEERATLVPLLARLSRREQAILYLRFFEDSTQDDIAARLGMSQMHVSRLLTRSLADLRARAAVAA